MPRARSQKALETEEKTQKALRGLSSGIFKTPYQAAKVIGLSRATLKRRMNGGKSRAEGREAQQLLSKPEEKALEGWITRLTATGHPARHDFIRDMAEEIRRQRTSGIESPYSTASIHPSWVQRFIKRHPHLKTTMTRSIEAARIKDVTKETVATWFAQLQETIEANNITLENIYNMDETGTFMPSIKVGFAIGTGQTSYAVVDLRLRRKYQAEPGRQEWITAVECICTDGSVIPPLIIFKGENLLTSWIPREIKDKWHFSCNSKGWTSNIHGEMWLEKCFEPATRNKANGHKRLLICDGHDSHISAQFVRFCIDHGIVLFLLPPHSSHLLQPLDVGVFGPLKRAMSSRLSRLYATEISRLQKVEWLEHYIQGRVNAITPQNVLGGWRGAGICPFNPHRVLRSLSDSPATVSLSPSQNDCTTLSLLITSSPPDAVVLQQTNTTFNKALLNASLATPV